MSLERARPIEAWAVGHATISPGMLVIRLRCANQPDRVFSLPADEAVRLAEALLMEAKPARPN